MRQAGKVLRFWMCVLGLVIGLQSACIAAGSDGSASSDQAVEGESSPSAVPIKEVAPAGESSVSGSTAPATEISVGERDRDHSARSPQEMLFLFLKGGAALTALVLFYKGLKRWFGPKRQSESE